MAASKKKKEPITRPDFNPSGKHPSVASEPTNNNVPISWHISLVEMVDPFGWHEIGAEKFNEIRCKLSSFESRTWNELLVQDKKHNHSVPIDELCKIAQDRLSELGQDDIDVLVSLRLSGKERIWGIRANHVFKILWWDPDHQVCPSPKRYT